MESKKDLGNDYEKSMRLLCSRQIYLCIFDSKKRRNGSELKSFLSGIKWILLDLPDSDDCVSFVKCCNILELNIDNTREKMIGMYLKTGVNKSEMVDLILRMAFEFGESEISRKGLDQIDRYFASKK